MVDLLYEGNSGVYFGGTDGGGGDYRNCDNGGGGVFE